jgi:hypothetical protein
MLADESGPEERTAVSEAKAFLRDILSEGPRDELAPYIIGLTSQLLRMIREAEQCH